MRWVLFGAVWAAAALVGLGYALPAEGPGPVPESYHIEDLTQADISAISSGLLELPGKTGLPILQKIQGQLNKQLEDAKAKAKQ